MKRTDLTKLNTLNYFTKETLRSLSKSTEGTLAYDIARFIMSGLIIQLRKGIYTTKEVYHNKTGDLSYKKLIANILREPSYVSLETVLSGYNMLTDVTYNFWSVTLKVPRRYSNEIGTFHYKQIKPELFIGYNLVDRSDGSIYYEATKAKALFDYIYYKSGSIKDTSINLVEDLRLNLDSITKSEWKEIEKYLKIANSAKLENIFNNLARNA